MKKRRRTTRRESPFDSKLEEMLHRFWVANYTEPIVPQHKFHPTRQWELDLAFPNLFIAVEIQGYGTGHTSYKGMSRDYIKHNEAMRLGWGIVYLMSNQLLPNKIRKTCEYIETILQVRRNNPTLLDHLKDLANGRATPIQKTDNRKLSPIDEARRRLLEGFD